MMQCKNLNIQKGNQTVEIIKCAGNDTILKVKSGFLPVILVIDS